MHLKKYEQVKNSSAKSSRKEASLSTFCVEEDALVPDFFLICSVIAKRKES